MKKKGKKGKKKGVGGGDENRQWWIKNEVRGEGEKEGGKEKRAGV